MTQHPRTRTSVRRWLLAAGLLPIALGGFAAFSAYDSGRLDLPEEKDVALVNDRPVSLERFNHLLTFSTSRVQTKDGRVPDADALLLKRAIVQKLIDEAVTDAAAKEQGIDVSEKDIDVAFIDFEKSFANEEALKRYVESTPDGTTGIRTDIRQRLLRERLAKKGVTVSYDEVKRYYESYPDNFHQPKRVNASEVLIRPGKDCYARAKELREKVAEGAIVFPAAAREYSEGPTRALSGARMGLTEATVDPAIWKAVVELEPGKLTEVIETKEGCGFYLLHEVLPELHRAFEDAAPEIQARLERLLSDARLERLLAKLRAKARIRDLFAERYAGLLEELLKPGAPGDPVSFSLTTTSALPQVAPVGPAPVVTSKHSRPRP